MDPNDRVDLASVNKTKKQFKLPTLRNPFKKKSAGPGRDQLGQFASGSGGLINTKHFSWSRALPLVLIVALAGGYLVYRSFAGTYQACHTSPSYTYAEECVTESDEAAVVRLYYGIFNRAPDRTGLQYWANKLKNNSISITEMARQFMGSSEFKNKYGTLSDEAFVKAMYPQVFGRNPDPAGLTYWTNKLKNKSVTRQALMVNFTQSSEMKRNFSTRVAAALGIPMHTYVSTTKTINPSEVDCLGSIVAVSNANWCEVSVASKDDAQSRYVKGYSQKALATFPVGDISQDVGSYLICFDTSTSGFIYDLSKSASLSFRSVVTDLPIANPISQIIDSYYNFPNTNYVQETSTKSHCTAGKLLYPQQKYLTISALIWNQPVAAKTFVKLDSIKIHKIKSNKYASPASQDQSLLIEAKDSVNQEYVGSTLRNLPVITYASKLQPGGKPWIHKSKDFVSGKGTIYVNQPTLYQDGVSKNVNIELYDDVTGRTVPIQMVYRYNADVGEYQKLAYSPGSALAIPNETIYIQFNTASAIKPRLEVKLAADQQTTLTIGDSVYVDRHIYE